MAAAVDVNKAFWDGVKAGKLLIQRCSDCGRLRQPVRPMCPHCNSLAWDMVESSGRGTVYTCIIPRHLVPEGEEKAVALIELEEGVRFVSNVLGVEPRAVEIGMPVELCFEDLDNGMRLPQFRAVGAGS